MINNRFDEAFTTDVYVGETITGTCGRFKVTATIHRDDYGIVPWKRWDCHGIVSVWTNRGMLKGERVLNTDNGSYRYYNFDETVKIAQKDGWGLGPTQLANLEARLGRKPTKREIAVEAVELDFQHLKGWCEDKWFYVGVAVTVTDTKHGILLTGECDHSGFGIESNRPDYLTEVANELFDEAVKDAEEKIKSLLEEFLDDE